MRLARCDLRIIRFGPEGFTTGILHGKIEKLTGFLTYDSVKVRGDFMLSQQDLSMIESMMTRVVNTAIKENNEEMKAYIDGRFEKNNEEMKTYIDGRFEKNNEEMESFVKEHVKEAIKESESFLLDEIERFYNFAKRDIQKLSAKVEEIAEYYRIRKNEESRYDYVIRLYHKQQQEINEIKQVLAI